MPFRVRGGFAGAAVSTRVVDGLGAGVGDP